MFAFLFNPNVAKLVVRHDIDGLLRAIEHKDDSVRQKALAGLLSLESEAAIDAILKLPNCALSGVEVWREKINLSALCRAATHQDPVIQQAAWDALLKIDSEQTLKALLGSAESTAYCLGVWAEAGNAEALGNLVAYRDVDIRKAAWDALLKIDSEQAIGIMLRNWDSARFAIFEWAQCKEVTKLTVAARISKDVRHLAREALIVIGSNTAFEALLFPETGKRPGSKLSPGQKTSMLKQAQDLIRTVLRAETSNIAKLYLERGQPDPVDMVYGDKCAMNRNRLRQFIASSLEELLREPPSEKRRWALQLLIEMGAIRKYTYFPEIFRKVCALPRRSSTPTLSWETDLSYWDNCEPVPKNYSTEKIQLLGSREARLRGSRNFWDDSRSPWHEAVDWRIFYKDELVSILDKIPDRYAMLYAERFVARIEEIKRKVPRSQERKKWDLVYDFGYGVSDDYPFLKWLEEKGALNDDKR